MLKFTELERRMPAKRDAKRRRQDFQEIYERFTERAAAAQAARCSQCGIPFCQSGCPLGNNIPDWLKLAAEDRLQEAYAVSSATNNMPEVCGRICPQDRLCEGVCVVEQSGHGTVTIGAVEQYITETAWDNGWVTPIMPAQERPESVGIVGAGPAGLAAAEELRKAGVQVTVYDRYDRAGGLLIYGIPNFKLEKHVITRRTDLLERGGIRFVQNTDIGKTTTFADLRAQHDAVLIATGVYKARDLHCPGSGSRSVVPALDYLVTSNRTGLGDCAPAYEDGTLDAKGRRVVVIGGGDTAMDCVRTAVRQGASSVTCVYRRNRENMPGSAREVAHAEEEGVVFEWLAAPKAVLGTADLASGVRCVRMSLGRPDASGRRAPEEIADSEFDLEADLIVKALGFEPEDLPALFNEPDLAVTARGTLAVDPRTLETKVPGVFAAGDIIRGASLVVWAIRDGREAASAILSHLDRATKRLAAE